jgi:beta-galactosidase
VALRLTSITGPGGLQANGSDIVLLNVEAVDKNGERCPTFQKRVDFACKGPAIWRGGYDSGKAGSINNSYVDLECGINRVAVRSTLQPGKIVVSANCDGLKAASISIPSLPAAVNDGVTPALPPMPAVALTKPNFLNVSVEPPASTAPALVLAGAGRYIVSFSYSGPTTIVHVEQNAADGRNIFVDRDQPFAGLPPELIGADWVQGANNDSTYSAVDLMQLAVKGGSIVTIAHDDRLPSPEWLTRQFQRTEKSLSVNGQSMTIFQHRAASDESLTLGSNTDDPAAKKANSYIVFVCGLVAHASAAN